MDASDLWALIDFYTKAKKKVIDAGYRKEIEMVEKRTFDDMEPVVFYWEYIYVVCNSGMKNQVAEKIFNNYKKRGLVAINHPLKKKAIKQLEDCFFLWFDRLKNKKSDEEKILYLETLPHIGKITKYHLARNLGIDCAKPDRHLVRMANAFGYDRDVHQMCKDIADETGDRIGTVDVVLWRYYNIETD